jgi:hypothetical protein
MEAPGTFHAKFVLKPQAPPLHDFFKFKMVKKAQNKALKTTRLKNQKLFVFITHLFCLQSIL